MKEYIVRVPEVHYQEYTVEAESESDAIERVADLQGDESENGSIYLQTLQPDEYEWQAEERPEEG